MSEALFPHFRFEREAMAQGCRWVAGVDEVGRGPLAARSASPPSFSIRTIFRRVLMIRR